MNILIIKDDDDNSEKSFLIDFDYSFRIGTELDSIFGTKEFMAEKLVFMDAMDEFPIIFKEIYDLESFVYTFLDCVASEFFELLNLEFIPSTMIADSVNDQNLTLAKEFTKFRTDSIQEIVNDPKPKQLASIKYNKKLLNIFR